MFASVLPLGSPIRKAVFAIASVAGVLLFCSLVLPEGAPIGVMLQGMVEGSVNALLAAGLILIYRNTRIINFAQAVIGGVASTVVFNMGGIGISGIGLAPFWLTVPLGLVLAFGLSMFIELLFVRRFFNSPRLVLTVVTVVAAPTMTRFAGYIDQLGPWTKGPDILSQRSRGELPQPFKDFVFELFPFRFRFGHVFALTTAIIAFGLLAFLLTRTKKGAAIRGTATNADRAMMLGINVRGLSTLTWGMAGLLSGLAAINSGLVTQFGGASTSPEKLLTPLAAAVIAKMENLPIAITAALTLGIFTSSLNWSYSDETLSLGLVLLVVLGGLLLQKSSYSRDEASGSSWAASKEIRPTPRELLDLSSVRRLRRGLLGLAAVILLVFPQAVSPGQVAVASLIAITSIVVLSIVVLTGWGGQVSLGQFAFVAVGAVVGGKLTGDFNLSFFIALPIAAAVSAGFAAAVGQPALRLRGPFLAVSTLAFALLLSKVVLDEGRAGALLPDNIERPKLLFISFASERAFYYLSLAFAVMAAVVVRRLRAGRTGRVLIALREDPFGVQPFGVNVARARLAVFALAGTLAGVAGVLLAHFYRAVEPGDFGPEASVEVFIIAMVGGVTSVSGAILGSMYFGITRFLINDEKIRELTTNTGLLYLLFVTPGGLAGVFYGIRDNILRIIATRRRMVVPSLFEDVDPEALLGHKAPLDERQDGRGLDELDPRKRYAFSSELYTGADRTIEEVSK